MVDDPALRVLAADAHAGVDTLVADAGLCGWTVIVVDTLRTASSVRIAGIFPVASAHTPCARHSCHSIGSARIGLTRINLFGRFSGA